MSKKLDCTIFILVIIISDKGIFPESFKQTIFTTENHNPNKYTAFSEETVMLDKLFY